MFNLQRSCDVFHFIISIDDIDAGINLLQFGIQTDVRGIEHVGDECHLTEIALVDHRVVLTCQLYALPLGVKVGIRLLIECPCLVYLVIERLSQHALLLLALADAYTALLHLLILLEERTDGIFHAHTHIPIIDVLVEGRNVVGKGT